MVNLFRKVKLVARVAVHKVKHALRELVSGSGRIVLWLGLGASFLAGYVVGSL